MCDVITDFHASTPKQIMKKGLTQNNTNFSTPIVFLLLLVISSDLYKRIKKLLFKFHAFIAIFFSCITGYRMFFKKLMNYDV